MSEKERMLNSNEVSFLVGCTVPTLTMWYKWKEENPDDELAQMLPDYIRIGSKTRGKRLWKQSDLGKIIEFRSHVKIGKTGFMGSVTQKYQHNNKTKEKKDE